MATFLRSIRKVKWEARLQSVMTKSGWSRRKAFSEMTKAHERLGITYADYDKNNFFKLSKEEQEAKAQKILRERKERNESIDFIVGETGRDRKEVGRELRRVKKEFFITPGQFIDERLFSSQGLFRFSFPF